MDHETLVPYLQVDIADVELQDFIGMQARFAQQGEDQLVGRRRNSKRRHSRLSGLVLNESDGAGAGQAAVGRSGLVG